LPITHERGYLIPAIGAEYERCAHQLRDSIHQFHPDAHVTIVTRGHVTARRSRRPWANDWQMFADKSLSRNHQIRSRHDCG
jgi:hypothetical protein